MTSLQHSIKSDTQADLSSTGDKQSNIFTAKVYLAESIRRGRQPFAFTLLTWAGNARRRAMETEQQQRSLF